MRRVVLALLLATPFAVAQETPAKAQKDPAIARIAEIKVKVDGSEDPHAPNPFVKDQLNYLGFLKFVRKAAHDPNLDAVILELKGVGVGWARLLEVRDALKELKRSGKKVFVYKEFVMTPDLVLASVADRISVPESGIVALPGLAFESWYMKEMLAKLRLRFDVVHIGEYKSAGEQLVRDSMSQELKDSLNPILDEFYDAMVESIAEGRGLKPDVVRKAIDKALMTPREAKEFGLIDRVEYYDQFKDGIKAHFGGRKLKRASEYGKKKSEAGDFAAMMLLFQSMFFPQKEREPEGAKVAVIYCTGAIVSGKSQYDWQGNIAAMGSETIVEAIERARKNKDVKAIVLRINSPGGSGLASDMIWRAVERAKESKPVISSMGDVAASGGYYIAMNSNAIVAEPQTITGSIGVVGMMMNPDDFFPWVGIKPERLVRGKRAAVLMTSKGATDEDKAMLRSLMRQFYGDFVAKVAAGRGKTPAEIEPIARGRVWTGRAALKNGLVDQLGGLEDAIALARTKAGIPATARDGKDFHILEYPRRKGPFEFLEEMFGARLGIDSLALKEMPQLREILRHLQMMRLVARDKICIVHPELNGFARPFRSARR